MVDIGLVDDLGLVDIGYIDIGLVLGFLRFIDVVAVVISLALGSGGYTV